MIPVTIGRLAQDCKGTLGKESTYVADIATAVTIDTRSIDGGEVFVAIRGERADGNSFAAQALAAGAKAVITGDPAAAIASGADPARLIAVDDPQRAIGDLARANLARIREVASPLVLAVTGSVGKTTTKDLLARILDHRGPIIAPPGSFNNELGLPLTVLRADASTSTLVLEMGADHIGNIEYLTSIAPPDACAVLIVARAHLGEFGGIENVQLAKSELVQGTIAGGPVVLNADDPRVMAMAELAKGPVVTFSATGNGDVAASDVRLDPSGRASFTLVTPQGSAPVQLGLVGQHHVANALAAAALSIAVGESVEHVAECLTGARAASPHRMDVIESDGATLIDDSYNANPDSMRAGIRAAGLMGQGRRTIAVLGEMLELGEASAAEHADLAPVLKDAGVAILVAVGDGVAPLAEAAFAEGIQVYNVGAPEEGTQLLRTMITRDDVVLIKGSHGSGVWRIADALREGTTAC